MTPKLHPVIERLQLFASSRQRIVQELCLSCSIREKKILANVLISLVVKIDYILIALEIYRFGDVSVCVQIVSDGERLRQAEVLPCLGRSPKDVPATSRSL